MNLILLFPEDYAIPPDHRASGEGRVRLVGRRLAHVRSIVGSRVGDELCVGFVGGRIGSGKVVRLDDEALELDVSLFRDPPAASPVTLVLALPRPLVLKLRVDGWLVSESTSATKSIRPGSVAPPSRSASKCRRRAELPYGLRIPVCTWRNDSTTPRCW